MALVTKVLNNKPYQMEDGIGKYEPEFWLRINWIIPQRSFHKVYL